MGWCSVGMVQAAPSHGGVLFPGARRRDEAEVSGQPHPEKTPSSLAGTTCLLTSLDFSAVRNPSKLSCKTETYKKLTHTVILRDVSAWGSLLEQPWFPRSVASKDKEEAEGHKAVQRLGLNFHYARGLPILALSLPLLFCSQDLLRESLWMRKPCGTAFSPKVTR